LFSGLKDAIAWFLDGLTEAVSGLADRIGKRTPVRLVDVGGGAYAIEHADGKRDTIRVKIVPSGEGARLQPAESAAQLADRDLDLVLPVDELLMRTLDPLPAESGQYLDGIVRHQLDRFVPWRADNVLYSYESGPVSETDDRLLVRVAATARTLHAPLIEAARAVNPRKVRLFYPGVGQNGGDIAIGVDDGGAGGARMGRLRLGVVAGLIALFVLSTAAFGYLIYAWQQTTDALAAAEQSEAKLRKQIGGRGNQETPATRDLRAILTRKQAQPLTVLAIEELSSALPDDTWLSELQINDGQLRVTGTSQSVADLVPAVQNSQMFADATVFSPTTRLPNNEGDRFHLQMRLVPPKAPAK
jgi:general secretion pathway protein L